MTNRLTLPLMFVFAVVALAACSESPTPNLEQTPQTPTPAHPALPSIQTATGTGTYSS